MSISCNDKLYRELIVNMWLYDLVYMRIIIFLYVCNYVNTNILKTNIQTKINKPTCIYSMKKYFKSHFNYIL